MKVTFDQRWHLALLEDLGLLEPDEPTIAAHEDHIERMESEFTPLERRLIRADLGLLAHLK